MANFGPTAILHTLLLLFLTAILEGLVLSWGWLIWRLVTSRPILPERPLVDRRAPPWGAGTMLLVVLFYITVNILLTVSYGLVAGHSPARPPALSAEADKMPLTHMMLLNGVLQVVMLLLVPCVMLRVSGARLRDVGLSFDGWWRQAALGVVATLIATPPVYAIQFLAMRIWNRQPHPVEEMIAKEFSVGVGGLAIVTAVILAPMFEELVFRGLLQSWLVALLNRRGRPSPVDSPEQDPGLAAPDELPAAQSWEEEPELPIPSPAAETEVSALLKSSSRTWIGIMLTSLLFAYVHAPQWPAPIALFALAMVIGTIFDRTGSLIAAIFMHATFNGISTAMLFMMALTGGNPGLK